MAGNALRLEEEIASELAALATADRRRYPRPPAGADFCSNDYLGLADHPAIRAALELALRQGLPLGGTSSRLIRGEHPLWAAREAEYAAWVGAEAALFFPSGYAANCGLLAALARRGDVIFSDRLNHASLLDGIRLSGAERSVVPHLDLAAWERAFARGAPARRRFAVVESLYSMEGDRAPLRELATLCARHEVTLIVDEAHATGVFGPGGAGYVAEAGLRGAVLATIHTCGKALGAAGAFVAGSAVLRELLINRARPWIFTTAPPPLLAVQVGAALQVLRAEPWRRERVRALARQLRRLLAASDLAVAGDEDSPILPVILGSDRRALAVAQRLTAAGYDVRAIRPPTVPEGTSRLRLVVHATNRETEIEGLAAALAAALAEAPA